MHQAEDIAGHLEQARAHAARGQDAEAKRIYLAILAKDPAHFAALNELAFLAHASGHTSAARTAYEQAVRCHPHNPLGRVNLGHMLCDGGDYPGARAQFEAALALDGGHAEAHRGLARVLSKLGDDAAAEPHWRKGFSGQAIAVRPHRGAGPAIAVLLIVSIRDGNIPTRHILDDRIFAVTALYAEYHDPALPLPKHDIVFNAVGDADLCTSALISAEAIVARTDAPVINAPARVRRTGRVHNAALLATLPGVTAPRMQLLSRAALQAADGLSFPLLLRSPGYHAGQNFLRVEQPGDLAGALASLPGEDLLAIDYVDARGADGMARKYRVMMIGGVLYPIHLAISADWKVHYFTAAMADDPAYRAEEQRFLEDMETVIGASARAALAQIGATLGLDYAGMDFALTRDGSVLLFEANATMVISPPPPDPVWDYRRPAIGRALEAAKRLLTACGKSAKAS
jgi:hypothetical protein